MRLFWKLVERGIVKVIKGKKRPYVSTGDLDASGKLRADYLKHREQEKKKKNEPKSYGWVD